MAPQSQGPISLLPAFLAGFAACGGLSAALWPTLTSPYEHSLRAAREEASAAQRVLTQERLMQQQVESARESAARLNRETCEQQVAQAVAEADARCTNSKAAAAGDADARCEEAVTAAVAAAAARSSSSTAAAAGANESCAPCAVGATMAAAGGSTDAIGGATCSACIAAATVLAGEAAAAKWPVTAALDGALRPTGSDELLLSYRGVHDDGTRVAEDRISMHLDDDDAAPVAGWATALRSMRRGEVAVFRLGGATAPDGAMAMASDGASASASTYEIELLEVTPVENLSPPLASGGGGGRKATLLKTILERGVGAETPRDGASVVLEIQQTAASTGAPNATGGAAAAPAERHEIVLGEPHSGGEALRRVVMSMARSELARVRVAPHLALPPIALPARSNATAAAANASSSSAPAPFLTLTLRLVSFEQPRALEHMSAAELLQHIERLKASANARFAAGGGETEAACADYGRALRVLRLVEDDAELSKQGSSRGKLELALRLNGAACYLRVGKGDAALAQSDAALALSPTSSKALFRRGQALQALGRLREAEAAFGGVIEREPSSREAHARLKEVRVALGKEVPAPAAAAATAAAAVPPTSAATAASAAAAAAAASTAASEAVSAPLNAAAAAAAPGLPPVVSVSVPAAADAAPTAAAAAAESDEGGAVARARAMGARELLDHVDGLKTAANKRFSAGERDAACADYDTALQMLQAADSDGRFARDEEKALSRALQLALHLNGAVCALRKGDHAQALAQSDAALALSPTSSKALFRRGQALQALGRLREAEAAFGGVIEREPSSREAHARLKEVRDKMAEM